MIIMKKFQHNFYLLIYIFAMKKEYIAIVQQMHHGSRDKPTAVITILNKAACFGHFWDITFHLLKFLFLAKDNWWGLSTQNAQWSLCLI